MSLAAQFERLLIDRRVGSRILENEFGLWEEAGVATVLGEHCFDWTRVCEPDIERFFMRASIDSLVLVGMGGATLSATAYECVSRKSLKPAFHSLSTTSPAALAFLFDVPPRRGFHYVIASKSGETVETLAIADSLLAHIQDTLAMTVITDREQSSLRDWAMHHEIQTIESESWVPGRFSSLGSLALVPAAMLGIETEVLQVVKHDFVNGVTAVSDTGSGIYRLAAELARVSMTNGEMQIDSPQHLLPVARWVEHLVTESLSKSGLGVLPVVRYRKKDSLGYSGIKVSLNECGRQPDYQYGALITDVETLGEWFLTWQTAVSMTAYLIGVDPYSQPEVDRSKQAALVPACFDKSEISSIQDSPYRHIVETDSDRCDEQVARLLDRLALTVHSHDYIALLAYVDPTSENEAELVKLAKILETLFKGHQVRVVYSFGPQYLHSIGQYHKATAKVGLMSQLTTVIEAVLAQKLMKPEQSMSSGTRCAPARTGHFVFIDADSNSDFVIHNRQLTFGEMIRKQAHLDAEYLSLSKKSEVATPSLVKCDNNVAASLKRIRGAIKRWVD